MSTGTAGLREYVAVLLAVHELDDTGVDTAVVRGRFQRIESCVDFLDVVEVVGASGAVSLYRRLWQLSNGETPVAFLVRCHGVRAVEFITVGDALYLLPELHGDAGHLRTQNGDGIAVPILPVLLDGDLGESVDVVAVDDITADQRLTREPPGILGG